MTNQDKIDALQGRLSAALPGLDPDQLSAYLDGFAAAAGGHDMAAKMALLQPSDDAAVLAANVERAGQIVTARAADFQASVRNPAARTARLAALRQVLSEAGLDGFIQPMADEYQNEYIPVRAQRIAWLTGFSGSAGQVAVLAERAVVLSDGRYSLQLAAEVDASQFETRHIAEEPLADWLAEHLVAVKRPGAARIGYDPRLHTINGFKALKRMIEKAGAEAVPVSENPIDQVWRTAADGPQPAQPLAPVVPHPIEFSGEHSAAKRKRMAAILRQAGAGALILTAPPSIAWLLNVRGGDVAHSPLPLSHLILRDDGRADLFLDRRKIALGLEEHLGNHVGLRDATEFLAALADLGRRQVKTQVDPASLPQAIAEALGAAAVELIEADDPTILAKACKNEVERAGARAAHHRDGLAECRFLHWLATQAQDGGEDELTAEAQLLDFRSAGAHFRDLSFETISGAGANGAIVHYRVSPQSNNSLAPGSLYLVDSGAQYLDGTTDITRTVAIGEPSAEMRDRFTRVLRGHIALATAVFPKGTGGGALDVLARAALWQAGLDFDHGTGHGVGSYLGVHEGPQRISKALGTAPLEVGMIVSNEPGYYKTGEYGIRIENLLLVQEAEAIAGGEREMLCFETLTLAPIDIKLILPDLLAPTERAWLNAYHRRVREALGPELPGEVAIWLDKATREI